MTDGDGARRPGRLGRRAALAALAGALSAALPGSLNGQPRRSPVESVLSGPGAGFERALGPRDLRFPRDHGAHPAFRSEWWYFTGNLADDDGARFGFQLTFFRFALSPQAPPRDSRWATNQLFMAHAALSDGSARRFTAAERFSRGALGLAGVQVSPFAVWLEDWRAASVGEAFLPLSLEARSEGDAFALRLEPGKPRVLQGERGYSRKGRTPGNASYYYSYTRLPARGTVTSGGRSRAVRGLAWLDREWSTSALEDEHAGWDWFALQFEDGWELMFYRIRTRTGASADTSAGTLVEPDGTVARLSAADVAVEPRTRWTTADGAGVYPVAWRVAVARFGIELEVDALFEGQEHTGRFRYWEGAVNATGRRAGRGVSARGYVELVGYAG